MAAKKKSARKKSRGKLPLGVILVLLAVCLVFLSGYNDNNVPDISSQVTGEQTFSMHVIDVGQGDAVLLSKDGKYALVDAGETMNPREREAREKLLTYLDGLNVTRLEFFLLTHQDYDHIGSAADVLKAYDVGVVYDNGVSHTSATYENLMTYILEENIPYRTVSAGDIIPSPWDEVRLDILSPPKDLILSGSDPDINENSVILQVTYGNVSYLLTGDAEKKAEQLLLNSGRASDIDILKAGHHASSTSSTQGFLNTVKPEVVVISVGAGNSYGHPHDGPMERFAAITPYIYRTDQNGSVVISTDGSVYSVVTA
jgi:beta-lactamase superfamily II metal-dependent hydrolase